MVAQGAEMVVDAALAGWRSDSGGFASGVGGWG
jgi:hypothetical protein